MSDNDEQTKKVTKKLLLIVAVFFVVAGVASAGLLYIEEAWEENIYPGVKIDGVPVGGKTKEEARQLLIKRMNNVTEDGIKFRYQEQEISLTPTVSSFNPELAYSIYSYNVGKMVDQAYQVGRSGNYWQDLGTKITTYFNSKAIPLSYKFRKDKIKEILREQFSQFNTPAENASLEAKVTDKKGWELIEFKITEESPGKVLNYGEAIQKMENRLKKLNFGKEIVLEEIEQRPAIRKEECTDMVQKAEEFMKNSPWKLLYTKDGTATGTDEIIKKWEIDNSEMSIWLSLGEKEGEVVLALDQEKIGSYLEENVSPDIYQEPVKAKFKIKNGEVVEFRDSRPGREINKARTIARLKDSFLKKKDKEARIVVEETKSEYTTANANDLGIKEKLGTGHSNFAGSPKNRVHNIHVGADSLDGLLVGPGEEFSIMQALGEINKNTGYLPELVIKENETKPEYGGGLCQIGTTMFRAALRSGLPITERQNHSYRVSYYEPPVGMDATIYNPHPDLRFKNDTGYHILIKSRIEGADIYFDLWGTDDGRTVTTTDPKVYNITQPKPPQMIKTTDIPPGEKKCMEKAHNGATAHFTYKVDYPNKPDKEDKKRKFYSYYQPWRKKCLVGVEEKPSTSTASSTKETTATSTEE